MKNKTNQIILYLKEKEFCFQGKQNLSQQDVYFFGSFATNKSLRSKIILLLHKAVPEEKEMMSVHCHVRCLF
jgi:hypothetical protein